jgi:hypothetical protein
MYDLCDQHDRGGDKPKPFIDRAGFVFETAIHAQPVGLRLE